MLVTLPSIIFNDEPIILTYDVSGIKPVSSSNFNLYVFKDVDIIDKIEIKSISTSGNKTYIIPTNALEHNKIYDLELLFIESDLNDGNFIEYQNLRFLSLNRFDYTNRNNVYTQIKNLSDLLSIDKLIENKNNTISYYPYVYNTELKKYEYSSQEIIIENNKEILNNVIDQYYIEYKNFFDIINNRDKIKTAQAKEFNEEYIINLHKMFMKNIVKWNSLKGNIYYINLLLSLYARYIGHNVISVVEDKSNNFMYRVSSSVPKTFWNKYIKPMIHPISWNCVYDEITSNIQGIYYDLNDIRKDINENWLLNTTSYLDAEYYIKKSYHFNSLFRIFHQNGNITESILINKTTSAGNDLHYKDFHQNVCTFKNINDETKIQMNLSGKNISLDYYRNQQYNTIKTPTNFEFHLDRFNKTVKFKYKKGGIAILYLWDRFNNNRYIDTTQSVFNTTTISADINDVFRLNLKRNNWEEKVFEFNQLNLIERKSLVESYYNNKLKNKFINIRNNSNRSYADNGNCIINYTSEYTSNNISCNNDFNYKDEYTNYIDSLNTHDKFNFIIDTNNNITTFSVSANRLKGIALKYKWELFINNSTLLDSKFTYFSNVSFKLNTNDYNNTETKIKLTVYFKNTSSDITEYTFSPYSVN